MKAQETNWGFGMLRSGDINWKVGFCVWLVWAWMVVVNVA
jgi:hypothetical protein